MTKINPYNYRIPRGEPRDFTAQAPDGNVFTVTVVPLTAVQSMGARGRGEALAVEIAAGRVSIAPVDGLAVTPDNKLCAAYQMVVEAQPELVYSFEEIAALAMCHWATGAILKAAAYARSRPDAAADQPPFALGGGGKLSAPASVLAISTRSL